MQDVHEIEESLRTIRRLMERGQRYEALTGRGALIVGVLSLALAGVLHAAFGGGGASRAAVAFAVAWPLLAMVAAAGLLRAALHLPTEDDAGRALSLTSSARAVVTAVIPAYALALAVAVAALLVAARQPALAPLLAAAWAAFHGVAILATAHHAPRRLVVLGWTFLVAGCAGIAALASAEDAIPVAWGNALMAATFGGFHVAYGLFSILRPLPAED